MVNTYTEGKVSTALLTDLPVKKEPNAAMMITNINCNPMYPRFEAVSTDEVRSAMLDQLNTGTGNSSPESVKIIVRAPRITTTQSS
ncbi:hypothetical protein N824_19545 [Pedobacter sp. V48]|nr:hypothetical protein N824_19545 [Pedobacter sp. V48]